MDRAAIEVRAEEFAAIARATVNAWDSRDLDAIRGLYTADVTHDDFRFSTHVEGLDAVIGIAESMFSHQTPDVRFRASPQFGPGFVGGPGGVMVWEAWEVFGFTDESPLVEVDRLEIRDGLIATWTLHYETSSPHDLITAYAAAWSSGDLDRVAALYGPAAIRDDAISGIHAEGAEAISDTAASFFADHPDAAWELLMPFAAGTTHGGIFAITDGERCPVRSAVLVRIDAGKIVDEEVYYEGASLLACDWLG